MNTILSIIRQKMITIGISIIIVLIMVSLFMTYYNKQVMLRTSVIKSEATEVKQRLGNIFGVHLQQIDLGLRGYALTKNPQLMNPFNSAVKANKENLLRLDTLFKIQQLDTTLTQFVAVKTEIDNYIQFCDIKMKEAAKKDSLDEFVSLLSQDKGYDVWKVFSPFFDKTVKYEDSLTEKAQNDYETAMNGNIILQVILCIVSLPVLIGVGYKINQDNKDRQTLLAELEQNNRKYIFDPGTDVMITNPKEVVENSIKNFQKASTFIKSISAGDFQVEWDELDAINENLNQENLVGDLIKMREQMKKVRLEDEKRSWTNEGLAKFSEIVRNHQNNLTSLSNEVVKFLTKYLKTQQGSLFVLKDEDSHEPYLELSASYAFDRKKFVDKKIDIGTGLVGQTFLEAKAIILKEIPQGYTAITSGLGDATPTCLAIVPMKYNDRVEAIIELAGFNKFEKYQIDFLEKCGEFVASGLLSVKTTEKMKILLDQSQEQAEIMKAQEEEMRQNMEELEATQEEIFRKGKEMEKALAEMQIQTDEIKAKEKLLKESELWLQTIINNLPKGVFWKESKNLAFLGANTIFTNLTGFNPHTIIGKTDYDCPWKKEEADAFREDDMEVIKSRKAKIDIEEANTNSNGETQWMSTTKVPIFDDKGEAIAVLGMFEDITQRKLREFDYIEKIKELEIVKLENEKLSQTIKEFESKKK